MLLLLIIIVLVDGKKTKENKRATLRIQQSLSRFPSKLAQFCTNRILILKRSNKLVSLAKKARPLELRACVYCVGTGVELIAGLPQLANLPAGPLNYRKKGGKNRGWSSQGPTLHYFLQSQNRAWHWRGSIAAVISSSPPYFLPNGQNRQNGQFFSAGKNPNCITHQKKKFSCPHETW